MIEPGGVSVERLSATYQERGRLDRERGDRLLRRLAEADLERAFAAHAVPDGLWCLRRVDVQVLLDPTASDLSLSRYWAASLAAGVEHAVAQRRTADVAHYRSLRDAALQLVSHAAFGRWDCAWAWGQLGLLDDTVQPCEAGPAIVRALTALEEQVVGLLVSAVERCGLAPLHRALGVEGWRSLALLASPTLTAEALFQADDPDVGRADVGRADVGRADVGRADDISVDADGAATGPAQARLSNAGRDNADHARPASRPGAPSADPGDQRPVSGSSGGSWHAVGQLTAAVLAASCFAAAVHRSGLRIDRRTAAAWAVLSFLEIDPLADRRAGRATVLANLTETFATAAPVRHQLSTGRGVRTPIVGNVPDNDRLRLPSGEYVGRTSPSPSSSLVARPRHPTTPSQSSRGVSEHDVRPTRRTRLETPDWSEPRHGEVLRARAGRNDADPAIPATTSRPTTWDEEDSEANTDSGVATAWGGLPFLLNTAALAGLPGAAQTASLGGRGIRWVMHALAQRLTPARSDDPAALALAGIAPAQRPPTLAEPAPTDDEACQLDMLADAWASVTLDRLLSPGATGATQHAASLDAIDALQDLVSRPAVIVGDPGWIEVHMALDGVRLDVRRAGLDLDPGWVPWLGAVVRFVYGETLAQGDAR